MRIASFAETGNIEVLHKGNRVLLGQMSDGRFLLNRQRCTEVGVNAYRRISECEAIVRDYTGVELVPLIWLSPENGQPEVA